LENPTLLPAELAEVIALYGEVAKEEVDADDPRLARVNVDAPFERELFAAYYRYCATSGCRFVREWAEADRNLRNISVALTAKRKGLSVGERLVGGGDIVAQLQRSSAADFGLKGEVGYIDTLIGALSEGDNLLEKEHRIDLIRWNMAEELATFDYFNVNMLLSYVARLCLVHRWAMLDGERGREMFRRLVSSLGAGDKIAEAERRYAEER
jgi:vacuolar-type H+-ATPase subunit C/Vma6